MPSQKLSQSHLSDISFDAQVSEHEEAKEPDSIPNRESTSTLAHHVDGINDDARSIQPENTNRVCVLILGMHRSGTSAITAVLSFLGAVLPKNVMGSAPSNETSHWEPNRIVEVHDRMLAAACSRWDDCSLKLPSLFLDMRFFMRLF